MQNAVNQQNIQQKNPTVKTVPAILAQQPIQYTQTQYAQQLIQPNQSTAQNIQIPQNGQNLQVPNYSGVNIQIFNPSVTPPGSTAPVYNVNAPNYAQNGGCYPCDYYTQHWGDGNKSSETSENKTENNTKKTEKREIVQLTDEYIKNLENYLNSQDKEVRLMGAKEVVARLEEDHSRKNDKALNALINKMLQDPSSPVRILALSALSSRIAEGDDFTVYILKQMQNSQSGYGQDALQASDILLKMAGKTVEKEFEVKNTEKTETKTETKTESKTESKQ